MIVIVDVVVDTVFQAFDALSDNGQPISSSKPLDELITHELLI